MQHPLVLLDKLLNRVTMYRLLVYSLSGFLAVAATLAAFGLVGVSAAGIVVSVAVLAIACYATNWLLARVFHASANSESWLITALILACILPPASSPARAALLALAATIAMASKYVLVRRGSHLFNPAALAALVVGLAGILPATWWIATPWLTPFSIWLALVILRKTRNFTMFGAFAGLSVLVLLILGAIQAVPLGETLRNAVLSWPILFLGGVMLTEPGTLPPSRYFRVLYALVVASIFASQLHIGALSATPQLALVVGNLFVAVVAPASGSMVRLRRITKLSPFYYELAFDKPEPRLLRFEPGQYLEWTLPHAKADDRGNRRTFSIASAPAEDELRIAIKRADKGSSFKRALLALRPGQRVRVAHVAGNFTLPDDSERPLVFIAGGIGITPFRSMVQQIVSAGQKRDITLIYMASRKQDFVYKDVLKAAEATGLRTHYVVGQASAQAIRAAAPHLARSRIYISGPDAMVTMYHQQLRQLGMSPASIVTDHFSGY